MIIGFVLLLSGLPRGGVYADPGQDAPTRLDDLVVTATRNQLNAHKVPASFSVIDRKLIDELPEFKRNVLEVLLAELLHRLEPAHGV